MSVSHIGDGDELFGTYLKKIKVFELIGKLYDGGYWHSMWLTIIY